MDALGPVTRLDDESDMRPIYLLRDWEIDERTRMVFHRPSRLIFLIDYQAPPQGEPVAITGLSARLAHVCDGRSSPLMAAREQLAKDAIHAFALSAEVCQQPIDPDEIPF